MCTGGLPRKGVHTYYIHLCVITIQPLLHIRECTQRNPVYEYKLLLSHAYRVYVYDVLRCKYYINNAHYFSGCVFTVGIRRVLIRERYNISTRSAMGSFVVTTVYSIRVQKTHAIRVN